MVIVSNYFEVETSEGKKFITLELTGKLEIVQSQTTGKMYATVRKCRIPSTFDKTIAESIVGTELAGEIVRVDTEPYEYLNKQTGEVMILQHGYAYRPSGSLELIGQTQVSEVQMA